MEFMGFAQVRRFDGARGHFVRKFLCQCAAPDKTISTFLVLCTIFERREDCKCHIPHSHNLVENGGNGSSGAWTQGDFGWYNY
jgi:hypothetical protein